MDSNISLQKIWFDDSMEEFKVSVSNGTSLFSCEIYTDLNFVNELASELNSFREHIYGGIYDIEMGEFGPEYGSGAFKARLHFNETGKLCISTQQQSEFFDFSRRKESHEAKFYLRTEPILLDNFITELKTLASGSSDTAKLECTS